MKKVFLLSVAAGISVATFAQKKAKFTPVAQNVATGTSVSFGHNVVGKTTGVGDTVVMAAWTTADTAYRYVADAVAPHDSGYINGPDVWGDKGFAQRFDLKGTDSTVKVLGALFYFSGVVNPASTHTLTINVWSEGAKALWGTSTTIYNSGFPSTVLASKDVSLTNIGIGVPSTAPDSMKAFIFATPTGFLSTNFFVGYTMNYDWTAMNGDTISVLSSQPGDRSVPGYTVNSATDTTINNFNCTQYSDGTWHDNFEDNFGLFNKLYIMPIVKVGPATNAGVSIVRDGLSFHGCYPNPASASTTVSFGLNSSADVTVMVMDMNGRVISTINEAGLNAGEHTVKVETANLAAGDYIYAIKTSNGDAIASQVTVIK